jgi:hypothetical protein
MAQQSSLRSIVGTVRICVALAVLGCALLLSATAHAQDHERSEDEGPGMFAYGFRGFFTGAELGLAVGFLATGSTFDDGEWRALVLGAGIGAVVGVGSGVTLGIVDTGVGRQPGTGWLVLRDMSSGVMLGGLTGAAVGALFWASSGRPKNVLTGLSYGALIGGAVGIAYGLVEAAVTPAHRRSRAQSRLGLTFALLPDERRALTVVPAVVGRF